MKAPTKLINGAKIIDIKIKDNESWYVLADNGLYKAQRWVVWTCFEDGTCLSGVYSSSLLEIVKYFESKPNKCDASPTKEVVLTILGVSKK